MNLQRTMGDVKPAAPPPYGDILRELATLHADLRRLETRLLQLVHDYCGVTDEDIGEVLGLSSQAAGNRRRRKV